MNIFEQTSDFINDFRMETKTTTISDILVSAYNIRNRLRKKAYLLDTYLSLFFTAINNTLAYESANSGFDKGKELRFLCRSVIDNTGESKDHKLYQKAVDILYSQKSILEYQERHTQYNLLFLALVDDFYIEIVTVYIEEQKINLHSILDSIQFQDIYNNIVNLVGEEEMEKLNLLLKHKFMVSPILSIFIQGFTNDVIYSLLSVDIETNKKMFQLTFDDILNID